MSPELEKIAARIRKILALAANNPNAHEAASAAAMAEKLMRKYQLDNETVTRTQFKDKNNFATKDVSGAMKRNVGHRPSKLPAWVGWLAVPTAMLYDCGARNVHVAYNEDGYLKHEAMIRFYGFAPDVECAAYCFEYLLNTLIASLRAYQKSMKRTKKASEDYRRGFTMAMIASLQKAIGDKKAEMEAATQEASRSMALVIVKLNAVEEHYGDFNYRAAKTKDRSVTASYYEGVIEGSKVDVRQRGVGAAGKPSANPRLR